MKKNKNVSITKQWIEGVHQRVQLRIKKKLQAEIEDGLENLTILNDVTIYDELIEYSGFGIHFDSKKEFDIMFSSSITAVFDSITMLMSRGNHFLERM